MREINQLNNFVKENGNKIFSILLEDLEEIYFSTSQYIGSIFRVIDKDTYCDFIEIMKNNYSSSIVDFPVIVHKIKNNIYQGSGIDNIHSRITRRLIKFFGKNLTKFLEEFSQWLDINVKEDK